MRHVCYICLRMGSFSLVHWMIVLVVVLLIFGPSKLASVGKGLGEGIRNFKHGLGGDDKKPEDGSAKGTLGPGESAGKSDTGSG